MTRFFLNVRHRGEIIIDEEGVLRTDFATVQREAVAGAREMIAADVRSGTIDLDQAIIIYDDAGSMLGKVEFAATLGFANSNSIGSRSCLASPAE